MTTSSSSPCFSVQIGTDRLVHGSDQAGELAHVGVHPALQRECRTLREISTTSRWTRIPALAISEHLGSRRFSEVVTEVFLQEAGNLFCQVVHGVVLRDVVAGKPPPMLIIFRVCPSSSFQTLEITLDLGD